MGRHVDLANRKKSVVGPDSKARFVCPACGAVNHIQVDTTIRYATPVRTLMHCQCGAPHTVYLQRRAVRKRVDLPGQLSAPRRRAKHPILVRNLSRTGVLLEHDGSIEVRVGDRLSVEFELVPTSATRFCKRITVRRIDGHAIGAEFTPANHDREYEHALAVHSPPQEAQ